MSARLRAQFEDYAAHHTTAGNRACHQVGIPLIVLTLFTLLGRVPLFELGAYTVTLAEVLLLAAGVYYLTLDAGLAALMIGASALLLVAGRQLPIGIGLVLFALGWALQFVGHYVYEKRSPAFFRNLAHLLVGPLWILAKATGRA